MKKGDQFGIIHYDHIMGGDILSACEQAITERDNDIRPWIFWFNGTPVPMALGDSAHTLFRRWWKWRDDYQKNPKLLLQNLSNMKDK